MFSRQLTLGIQTPESFTLANYLAPAASRGDNQLAVAALLRMLGSPASRDADSVLTLWGPEGSGKSHLLMGACNLAGESGLAAGYFPLRQFAGRSPDLLQNLQNLDLVCLDDLDIVAGNRPWEDALLELFNRAFDSSARLVMASRASPRQLPWLLADLGSRLAWGAGMRLGLLRDEEKICLLIARTGELGLHIGEEVAAYLLNNYSRNLHALMPLVQLLDQASLAEQRRLTIPFIKEIIGVR